MPTWKQFISDIQTSIKAISSDSFIPPRYIYSETQTILADYIKKDNDSKKKLTRISDGWSELECIDLEEIDVIQCADINVRMCNKMMKSLHPIPEIYTYSYGDIIEYVASPNFSYFFTPITPREWGNIQKQKYKNKNKYYYFIIDRYLYLPVPKEIDLPIETLRMKAYFKDKKETEKFSNLKSCGDCPKPDGCKSVLDYDVVMPSYLENDVKKELLNRIANIYLKISLDEYPNLNTNDKGNNKDIQTYGG